jgi:hypothetical protein
MLVCAIKKNMYRFGTKRKQPMNMEAFRQFREEIIEVLATYNAPLAYDSAANAKHYLDVNELEMACESLVLSLMGENVPISDSHAAVLSNMCKALALDQQSIFREDFWSQASKYLVR